MISRRCSRHVSWQHACNGQLVTPVNIERGNDTDAVTMLYRDLAVVPMEEYERLRLAAENARAKVERIRGELETHAADGYLEVTRKFMGAYRT